MAKDSTAPAHFCSFTWLSNTNNIPKYPWRWVTQLQIPDGCSCKLNMSSASTGAFKGCFILTNDILVLRKKKNRTEKFRLYWCMVIFLDNVVDYKIYYITAIMTIQDILPSSMDGAGEHSEVPQAMGWVQPIPHGCLRSFAWSCANTPISECQLSSGLIPNSACAVDGSWGFGRAAVLPLTENKEETHAARAQVPIYQSTKNTSRAKPQKTSQATSNFSPLCQVLKKAKGKKIPARGTGLTSFVTFLCSLCSLTQTQAGFCLSLPDFVSTMRHLPVLPQGSSSPLLLTSFKPLQQNIFLLHGLVPGGKE